MQKFVCKKHIDDKAITRYIARNGNIGTCDYCSDAKNKTVIELDQLAEYIEQCLYFLYDDAEEWLPYESAEGGYQGRVYDTGELLRDYHELEMDEQLFDDLVYEIPDHAWCDRDPFGDSESDELVYDWNDFKQTIQHKVRYTIFLAHKVKYFRFTVKVAEILDEVGNYVKDYQLIRQIPKGTPLFRCQQHNDTVVITQASQIASPPKEFAIHSNRMSPAGVSMFYGSFNPEIAAIETVNKNEKTRNYYTIARFLPKSDLSVIDLSVLPPVPSIFNDRKRKHYHPLVFLRAFVNDVSRPIFKESKAAEHIEYIPTQTVTEYFRYILTEKRNIKIDGIIYPCSKKPAERSCVLFLDHEESLKALRFDKRSIVRTKI